MKTLNKTDIGLGLVRNRIVPSTAEFNSLFLQINSLISKNTIQGDLTTLSHPNVTINSGTSNVEIDLTEINILKINVDSDNYSISLINGEEGVPFYFKFSNNDSYDITWTNLRTFDGMNPGLSFSSNGNPSITIIEIIRLGNFYYLKNIYREDPLETLNSVVSKLNIGLDSTISNITGILGRDSGGNPISYTLGTNGALLNGTTVTNNIGDLSSVYEYVFEIPQDFTNRFLDYILYTISFLEPDLNNFYIKLT